MSEELERLQLLERLQRLAQYLFDNGADADCQTVREAARQISFAQSETRATNLQKCPKCEQMVRPDAPSCLDPRFQYGGACHFHNYKSGTTSAERFLDRETIDWMLRQSDYELVRILFTAGQIKSEQYWRLLMPVLRGSRTPSSARLTSKDADDLVEECAQIVERGGYLYPSVHAAAIRSIKRSP